MVGALSRHPVIVVLAALLHASSARSATAQQVAYAATVMGDLDSVTTVAVSMEISRARGRGIPVEPLLAKIREGSLKRATGARIRSAVTRLAERLDSARVALGAEATVEELVAGADALAAGAGSMSLRALRASTPRRIEAPLGTLAQLVASGVAPSRAVEMLVALLRRNARPAQVASLGNLVEADVASGLRADHAATLRLRGIEATLGLGDAVEVTQVAPASPPVSSGSGAPPARPKPQRRP